MGWLRKARASMKIADLQFDTFDKLFSSHYDLLAKTSVSIEDVCPLCKGVASEGKAHSKDCPLSIALGIYNEYIIELRAITG